jgi:hypothetical protein
VLRPAPDNPVTTISWTPSTAQAYRKTSPVGFPRYFR